MILEGAIFDLDGTLLDSMYIWDTVGEDYVKSKGIVPRENLRETFKTMSLFQAADYLIEKYNISDSSEKICSDINKMVESFYIETALIKDGVKDFLAFLKNKGVKMCIATATDRYLAEAALKRNNILDCFDRIFTCGETGQGKDKPDIFLAALAFLATDKRKTAVFEDAAHAAGTAKAAGFPVFGVFDASEDEKAIKESSDIYIKSFTEARNYID